jgi:hypothetical protein
MLKRKRTSIGGKEKTIEIGSRRITVREPTAEEILHFYQEDESFLALSRYAYGDNREVIEMLELCTDLSRKELLSMPASDFYQLVSVLREVHADFLPILQAEMDRINQTGKENPSKI